MNTFDPRPSLRRTLWAWPTLLALCGGATVAQTSLQPSPQRITDSAITADQRGYEAMQSRIKALNDGGRPLRDYHLAKAQCWLDVSFHEYTRNDRGAFPQAALSESETLVRAMESRVTPLPLETPLVAGAVRLRGDLWQRAQALRGHSGWTCAAAKAACGEVELVHAGHEQAQIGWRHAKPYVQIAEDLVGEAEQLAKQCTPPPPPPVAVVTPPPPPTPPAPVAVAPLNLVAQVMFRFDRALIADVTPTSLASLQSLLDRVRTDNLQVLTVELSGHADRLNGTGKADYNQRLSERRVQTVLAYLSERGIDAGRIKTVALGDSRPVEACAAVPRGAKKSAPLQECLLPNRRVEVRVSAAKR